MKQEPSTQAAFRDQKQWFATFLSYSNQKDVQRSATLRGLREDFPEVWQRIKQPEYVFSSVFVGAGNGGLEIPLMQEFAEARGSSENLQVFCEDPSPQMREGFHTAARMAGVDNQLRDYSLISFEDDEYRPPQADFALASHVWYYVQNWRGRSADTNSLTKFISMLRTPGVGLITLYSATSDRYLLRSNFASAVGTEAEPTGEDVVSELKRLEISHSTEVIEARTDVSRCFSGDKFVLDVEGKMLVSFLLRAAWDDQSPDIHELVSKDMMSLVKKNRAKELIFRDLYIWLSKS